MYRFMNKSVTTSTPLAQHSAV